MWENIVAKQEEEKLTMANVSIASSESANKCQD